MPTLATTSAQAVAALALLVLVATAYRAPRARTEALVALGAAAATLAVALPAGAATVGEVLETTERLLPVVLFLVSILVVAELCARAGLFEAAGRRVVAWSGGRPAVLLLGVFALAAVVTVVFSLDATAVLLTPVVLVAAAQVGTPARPGAFACLRMANSASLLLPVSNLTNLLALPDLDLDFTGFAARMAPVMVVVLLAEWVALRWWARTDLRPDPAGAADPADPADPAEPTGAGAPGGPAVPWVPVAVVAAMLAGFVVGSPLGVEPAWVSGSAALLLLVWARRRGVAGPRDALVAAHPSFALFVLALGVVVAVLSGGVLGDLVGRLVPSSTSVAGLLGVAVLATVVANLVTNLSATLLVVPLVAPLGDTAVLAALLGLNIGSGLTYSGSLANLLWRRGLAARGEQVSMATFHRFSLLATPPVLVLAVLTLAATS